MTHASLFSGIGGPDCASAMLGWRNAFHCEINPFGRSVLEYWFPESKSYEDITKTDFRCWRGKIDVLTAGFPCFVAGTPVLTNRGFVPIEDVIIGDFVLTADTTYHTVDAIMEHPADKIVTMRAQGMWEPLRATPNHKFWVRKRVRDHRAYHFSEPQWIPLSECRKGDRIGYPIHESNDTPETPAFWKLVGTYMADGWINEGKVVICCGKHHVERLLGIINAAGYHCTLSKERTVCKAIICNKALAGFFKSFGKYAHGKFLPGFCFTLENERKKALLEGWFADGYQTKRGHIHVTTVSQQLALGMSQLARDVYRCPVSVGRKTVNRTCVIEGRVVNERPQYCVRIAKSTRYGTYEYGHVWCNIKSIETKKEDNTVYNLSVNEEHSYTVFGISVSNCQPFSFAGKRGGDSDERYIWPEAFRAVAEIRPTWFVGENVAGIATMVEAGVLTPLGREGSLFGEVDGVHRYGHRSTFTVERICKDLEDIGYSVQPVLIWEHSHRINRW